MRAVARSCESFGHGAGYLEGTGARGERDRRGNAVAIDGRGATTGRKGWRTRHGRLKRLTNGRPSKLCNVSTTLP